MSHAKPLRILAVGDPFMAASEFTRALAALADAVEVTEFQIEDPNAALPKTPSEQLISEYAGDPAAVAAALAGHEVLVVHGAPVTAEVLDAAPLRLVSCARGGPVNVDIAAATERGIPVTNSPGKNAQAVAELTLALALMLIRGVPGAARYLLDGGRHADNAFEGGRFIGGEAASMTFGLVGLIVSVHARANVANRHMFGAEAFARMPRGSYFINTARESLVDEEALHVALTRGWLAGAALDVVERRPGGSRHPLLELPNVIITPHIGGATRETLRRGAEMVVAAVTGLLAGEEPAYLLNPEYQQRKAVVS